MEKNKIIKEYLSFIKKYKIPTEDFVLCAGGACVMYGIREDTEDMDMDVSRIIFEEFKNTNKYKIEYFGSTAILRYNDNIDLHVRVGNYKTRIVEGVCCYSPKDLLIQKLHLNRPKDQNDIFALQELLRNESIKPHFSKW